MTEQPTREQLLHLADRARRGVALDAEHDALAAGINIMCDAVADTTEALRLNSWRLDAVLADRESERAGRVAERKRAERAEAALRDAAPILQRALDCLDTTCRYHGDRLDPDEYGRRVRSEACCDTGIEPRRAREAKTALARMRGALEQPQHPTT